MDRQPRLEGERLQLRPLREGDRDSLYAVASDRALWALHPAHERWQRPVFGAMFAEALANGGALAVIDRGAAATGDRPARREVKHRWSRDRRCS